MGVLFRRLFSLLLHLTGQGQTGRRIVLVLSRKTGESIIAGLEGMRITVLEISGSRVKIGFEVDGEVPIFRAEVWERIHGNDGPPAYMRRPLEVPSGRTFAKSR